MDKSQIVGKVFIMVLFIGFLVTFFLTQIYGCATTPEVTPEVNPQDVASLYTWYQSDKSNFCAVYWEDEWGRNLGFDEPKKLLARDTEDTDNLPFTVHYFEFWGKVPQQNAETGEYIVKYNASWVDRITRESVTGTTRIRKTQYNIGDYDSNGVIDVWYLWTSVLEPDDEIEGAYQIIEYDTLNLSNGDAQKIYGEEVGFWLMKIKDGPASWEKYPPPVSDVSEDKKQGI